MIYARIRFNFHAFSASKQCPRFDTRSLVTEGPPAKVQKSIRTGRTTFVGGASSQPATAGNSYARSTGGGRLAGKNENFLTIGRGIRTVLQSAIIYCGKRVSSLFWAHCTTSERAAFCVLQIRKGFTFYHSFFSVLAVAGVVNHVVVEEGKKTRLLN